MNLNNHAEKHGLKIIFIFVLIDLKGEIKEDIVFVMKTKTHKENLLLRWRLFDYHKGCIQLETEKF